MYCAIRCTSSTSKGEVAVSRQPLILIYEGTMHKSVTYLKRVSAATFFATLLATPLTVLVQSSSPLAVAMLFSSAILTSGLSTLAVNWACNPYVCRLYKHPTPATETPTVTAVTLTFFGREVATTLKATALTAASRAFATWKLRTGSEVPSESQMDVGRRIVGPSRPLFNRKYFYIHQDTEGKSKEFREIVALVSSGGVNPQTVFNVI
ncbi:hypothetical protein SeMB42_g00343 [Synchytrium endobioticum]|uniref:Uncharacterized protein n=1 Tax=Synchytrium endobioticum TaxID=286115 RepID=A0A507DSN7_9FUNG|nr:hypothetical protein SeMB42_g00343 [Synchytrium endobioticum]